MSKRTFEETVSNSNNSNDLIIHNNNEHEDAMWWGVYFAKKDFDDDKLDFGEDDDFDYRFEFLCKKEQYERKMNKKWSSKQKHCHQCLNNLFEKQPDFGKKGKCRICLSNQDKEEILKDCKYFGFKNSYDLCMRLLSNLIEEECTIDSLNLVAHCRFHLFETLKHTYVKPLSELVRKTTCNLNVAKLILWFLYPDDQMNRTPEGTRNFYIVDCSVWNQDVRTIWKALEDITFSVDCVDNSNNYYELVKKVKV